MSAQATARSGETDREAIYTRLMIYACGQDNDQALARMYASWATGEGALPVAWGLSPAEFATLMQAHFPGYGFRVSRELSEHPAAVRQEEVADLENLMLAHRAERSPSETWMATVVATACLASDHLWQDLGLWCRDELSGLMRLNFPSLAEKNVHNMKWKKFLYKQLCVAEDVYVCRAPSCEVCADYDQCFGPEE